MNSFNQQDSAFNSAINQYTQSRSTVAQQYLQSREQASGASEQATATIQGGKAALENAKAANLPTMALDHLGLNVSTKMGVAPAYSAIQKGVTGFGRGARSSSNWIRQTGRQYNNDPLKQSFNRDTPEASDTTQNPLFDPKSADPATVEGGDTKPPDEPAEPESTSDGLDDDALDDIFPESTAGESAANVGSMGGDFTGTPNIDIFSNVRPPPPSQAGAPAPPSQGAPGAPGEAAAPPPQAQADLPGGRASPAPEQAEEPAAPEPTEPAAPEVGEVPDKNPLQSEATMDDSGGDLMTAEQTAAKSTEATSSAAADDVAGLAEETTADVAEATGGALTEGLAGLLGGASAGAGYVAAGLGAIAPLVAPVAALVGLGEGIKSLVDFGENESKENEEYKTASAALSTGQNKIDSMSASISSDQFASQVGTNVPKFGSLAAPTFDTSQMASMGATHF